MWRDSRRMSRTSGRVCGDLPLLFRMTPFKTTHERFGCGGCSCLCESVSEPSECGLHFTWATRSIPDLKATVDGIRVDVAEAIRAARRSMSTARSPLICGGGASTVDTQRSMVDLAERFDSFLDSAESDAGQWDRAFQIQGQATATWGEVRDRADILLYWRFDPRQSHPRHFARFVGPQGSIEGLQPTPRLVRIAGNTEERDGPWHQVLSWNPAADLEVLQWMRCWLRNPNWRSPRPDLHADVPGEEIRGLLAQIRESGFAAVVCGPTVADGPLGLAVSTGLLRWVRELNRFARAVIVRETRTANATGRTEVFSWRTGYPGAIRFTGKGPQYDPLRFTARTLLSRRRVDCVLVVEPDRDFPFTRELIEFRARGGRLVVAGGDHPELFEDADISIPTARAILDVSGEMYRADGVPLRLASRRGAVPAIDLPFPAHELLGMLAARDFQPAIPRDLPDVR